MSQFETIRVNMHKVVCDGGAGALGHPRIFMEIGEEGVAVCPYCSKRFEYTGMAGNSSVTKKATKPKK